jgi:hypothetical protein
MQQRLSTERDQQPVASVVAVHAAAKIGHHLLSGLGAT